MAIQSWGFCKCCARQLIPAGYASVKVVQFWQAGTGDHNPDTCLGVVLNGRPHGWHLRCSWRPVVASSGR